MTKSPFYIVEEFCSPYMCEEIIDTAGFNVPDTDKDGYPIKTVRTNERAEQMIYERLLKLIPTLETYYNFNHKGTETIVFEWFPETYDKQEFVCENSRYLRQKWLRTKSRDYTGVLFLCDFQDKVPFEHEFEVYGGKLEFPSHRFGFNPQRGTLVFFPSDPHFINITTPILAGDLFQARIQLAAQVPYFYNPNEFPGNYMSWFQPLLSK